MSSGFKSHLMHYPARAQKNKKKNNPNKKEKLFYIFSKKKFSYISVNETQHFWAQALKIKKSIPRKFLILQETETPKKRLIFSLKKAALMFPEMETGTIPPPTSTCKFFIFQVTEFSEFEKRKNSFLIRNFSTASLEIVLYARNEL